MKGEENKTTKKIITSIKSYRRRKNNNEPQKKLTARDIKKYPVNQIDHVIYKMKEQEKRITIISVTIILTIVLLIGYIVFSAIQKTPSNNTLKDKDLLILYNPKENDLGNVITLVNEKVLTDKEGKKTSPYTILIKNTDKIDHEYTISIVEDSEMIEIDNCQEKLIPRSNIKYSIDEEHAQYLKDDENIIYVGNIKANEMTYHTITVWLAKNETKTHFHGKIVVNQK